MSVSKTNKEFKLESTPTIYRISTDLVGVEFNISESYDLSNNLGKEVHVVIPQLKYNLLGSALKNRPNNNSKNINFYSQAGGKSISVLKKGSTNLSNINYTPHLEQL